MDFITSFGLVIGIIGVVVGLPSFIYFLGDRVSFFKKANYFLTNKKFKTKISATRKYPFFDPNMSNLKENINHKFKNQGEGFDYQNQGSNFIQLLLKDMQAPYFIKFMPESDPNYFEKRTIIHIDLLGTLTFRYREELDNKKYLMDIEELFKIVESTHQVVPIYENYNLISTFSEFKEKKEKSKTLREEHSIINVGDRVLNIHSESLNHIYDVNKKYLVNISTM